MFGLISRISNISLGLLAFSLSSILKKVFIDRKILTEADIRDALSEKDSLPELHKNDIPDDPRKAGNLFVSGGLVPKEPGVKYSLEKTYKNAINSGGFVRWSRKNAIYLTSMGHEKYKNLVIDFKQSYMKCRPKLKALMKYH